MHPLFRRFIVPLACLTACLGPLLTSALAQPPAATKPESEAEEAREKKPKSQRWQVSWAVDPAAHGIPARPIPVTIPRLLRFKRPKNLAGTGTIPAHYRTHRISGVETHAWSVRATVVNVAFERDGDYRLILSDGKGAVLTCVLPDPARAPKRGRYSAQVDAARAVVARKLHPALEPRDVNVPVRLVGLGYFGRFNSDANKSPEGFQLHPVYSVQFPGSKSRQRR
jgi:hypothetical protein